MKHRNNRNSINSHRADSRAQNHRERAAEGHAQTPQRVGANIVGKAAAAPNSFIAALMIGLTLSAAGVAMAEKPVAGAGDKTGGVPKRPTVPEGCYGVHVSPETLKELGALPGFMSREEYFVGGHHPLEKGFVAITDKPLGEVSFHQKAATANELILNPDPFSPDAGTAACEDAIRERDDHVRTHGSPQDKDKLKAREIEVMGFVPTANAGGYAGAVGGAGGRGGAGGHGLG